MNEQLRALRREVRLMRIGLAVGLLLFVTVAAYQQEATKLQTERLELLNSQGEVVATLTANGLTYKLDDGTQAGFGLVEGRPVIRMEDKLGVETMLTTGGLLMSGGGAKAAMQPNRLFVSEGNAKCSMAIQRNQGQISTTDVDGDLNWSTPVE